MAHQDPLTSPAKLRVDVLWLPEFDEAIFHAGNEPLAVKDEHVRDAAEKDPLHRSCRVSGRGGDNSGLEIGHRKGDSLRVLPGPTVGTTQAPKFVAAPPPEVEPAIPDA